MRTPHMGHCIGPPAEDLAAGAQAAPSVAVALAAGPHHLPVCGWQKTGGNGDIRHRPAERRVFRVLSELAESFRTAGPRTPSRQAPATPAQALPLLPGGSRRV